MTPAPMPERDSEGAFYLQSYLAPLAQYLARTDVTDLYVNRPGEVWTESLTGAIERHEAPALSDITLARLARQIAALSHQGVNREHPLLAAVLPDGSRVQVAAPPATRGPLALAIRKHVAADLTLGDYLADGAFDNARRGFQDTAAPIEDRLAALLEANDIAGVLATAVRARRNILVSGGTSTGKTTFLNALLREVPPEERLILIEDTPELRIHHANAVGLVAVRGQLGEARVTPDDLLAAALRMRPDRIIVGELRGAEALTFLRVVNTGHPGSMTTIHADSAERAVQQLAMLVMQAGTLLGQDDITRYARSTIDVFVHLDRSGGRRRVAQVMLNKHLGG